MPSLVALSFEKSNFEKIFNLNNLEKKHENVNFENEKINDLKKYFVQWDNFLLEKNKIQLFYHWSTFTDDKNLPASNPPWGSVVSMNIKTGKIITFMFLLLFCVCFMFFLLLLKKNIPAEGLSVFRFMKRKAVFE